MNSGQEVKQITTKFYQNYGAGAWTTLLQVLNIPITVCNSLRFNPHLLRIFLNEEGV